MTEQKIRQRLKSIRCFVLDMDGTIYLGDRLFPFTKGFLEKAGRWEKRWFSLPTTLPAAERIMWRS